MAQEAKRGCGYRKVGGLYLVSGKLGRPCCMLPIPLLVCPTCGEGVKQSLGFRWIEPQKWLQEKTCTSTSPIPCALSDPSALGERIGLMWVGTQFYPTVEDFTREAESMGVSKRIHAVPRDFKLGETWVALAHPLGALMDGELVPGIFRIFKPDRIEKIVTESQAADQEEMAKLAKRGITPVVVPDDDRDHQGSVYDKPDKRPPPSFSFNDAVSANQEI